LRYRQAYALEDMDARRAGAQSEIDIFEFDNMSPHGESLD
jgi:hypothetical protein